MRRASRDYDLFGIASHRSSRLQVLTDCLSKFDRSARVGISQVALVQRTEGTSTQFAPERYRPSVHKRAPQVERSLFALHRDINEIADGMHLLGAGLDRRNRF